MICVLKLKLKEIISESRPATREVPFAGGQVNPPELYTAAKFEGLAIDEETGDSPAIENGSVNHIRISISSAMQNSGINTVHANTCHGVIDGLQGHFSVDPAFFVRLLGMNDDEFVNLRVVIDFASMFTTGGAQIISTYSFSLRP